MELMSPQDGSPRAPRPFPVETNLVFAAFPGKLAADVSARIAKAGVLANPEGSRPDALRFVTHLDLKPGDVLIAAERIQAALA